MTLCACGCGKEVNKGNKYIWGHSNKFKKNMIPWNKGLHWDDVIKQKISKSNIGKIPWNKDIPCSEETKRKIAKANEGKHPPQETLEKMSKSHLGSKHSNETKRKMSASSKNKPKSEEHKKKLRKPKSEKAKKHMCENHANFFGKNNPMYGKLTHSKGYYYNSPLQGEIWLRSSYEIAYAKYLDDNHILWMYEMETFELSDEMTYTPDFFLPRFEKFIDTKGYMRPEAQIKINKFLEEYPWDLEILYKKDLIKLGIKI